MNDHLSEEELLQKLEDAKSQIEIGGVYSHYRDPESRYVVKNLSIIETTQSVGVVYQKKNGSETLQKMIWVRPFESWTEQINNNNTTTPRFIKVLSSNN